MAVVYKKEQKSQKEKGESREMKNSFLKKCKITILELLKYIFSIFSYYENRYRYH